MGENSADMEGPWGAMDSDGLYVYHFVSFRGPFSFAFVDIYGSIPLLKKLKEALTTNEALPTKEETWFKNTHRRTALLDYMSDRLADTSGSICTTILDALTRARPEPKPPPRPLIPWTRQIRAM